MGPVALRFELLRQVVHLIGQNPFLGEVVPLVGVGSKRYCQEGHVSLLRCLAVLEPVTALAGRHDVFPLIGAAA